MAKERGIPRSDRPLNEHDVAIALDDGKTRRTEARWRAIASIGKAIVAGGLAVGGYVIVPTIWFAVVGVVAVVVIVFVVAKMTSDRHKKQALRDRAATLEGDNDRLRTTVDDLLRRIQEGSAS